MDQEYTPKILLVDDIEENLMTLGGSLRNIGAKLISVQSGKEALLMVKQHDFALIILDVQMPEMNGYKTAEHIRQGRRNKHTPIIFLTAVYYDQNSVYKGYQTGAVDYITKPFNREILISKVKVFLDLDMMRNDLIRSKQEFQSIVQDQTDLICRVDKDYRISFANRAFLIAFTKTFENLKGENIFAWIAPGDRDKISRSLAILTPTNSIIKIHHTLEVNTTRKLWASTVFRALFDSSYNLTGYQLVMRDITTEIQTREELIGARKKAEEATQYKSKFLANMSHEIRTPMNSILGMIDVLMDTSLDEDQQEDLEVIRFSARKLLDILNDILDFSKIEANQLKIETIDFNLHQELNKTVRLFETKAGENGNKIFLSVGADVPTDVKGDPLRIGQILINLLNNAIKFTKNGTIEIAANSEVGIDNKKQIRFQVVDSGIGMPEEIRKNIFNFFEQGDPSITREYGGSGLGLAISKSLCEMMGGKIGFESEENKGSKFWFSLSFENDPVVKGKVESPSIILVVEDNLLNQKVVGATLKKNGFKFELAANGKEAVDMVMEKKYDLIIMDIQMPVMDGYEATRKIREYESSSPDRETTSIIALTANATREDQDRCINVGMNGYLTKPFKFIDLEKMIRQLF